MKKVRFHLRELLMERRIAQKTFAKLVDVRYPTIGDYCTNKAKTISLENAEKIVNYLGIELHDLISTIEVNEESEKA